MIRQLLRIFSFFFAAFSLFAVVSSQPPMGRFQEGQFGGPPAPPFGGNADISVSESSSSSEDSEENGGMRGAGRFGGDFGNNAFGGDGGQFNGGAGGDRGMEVFGGNGGRQPHGTAGGAQGMDIDIEAEEESF